jgi:hypothetical protein
MKLRKSVFTIVIVLLIASHGPSSGLALDEDYYQFVRDHNGYDTPHTFWHFEITTPTQKPAYPLYYSWDKDQPFLGSTLSFLFANRISIKSD